VLFRSVNALSNFVADPDRVIGFNPYTRLADFLIAESRKHEAHGAKKLAADGVRS
jgi:hypothetical protein